MTSDILAPITDRLRSRVRVDINGCWIWTRALQRRGYGSLAVDGRTFLAHRLSYEAFVGPIPADMQIDHLCCEKRCINPEHLEVVTASLNAHRAQGWSLLRRRAALEKWSKKELRDEWARWLGHDRQVQAHYAIGPCVADCAPCERWRAYQAEFGDAA